MAAGPPAPIPAGRGLGAHLAHVEVQHGPLAAQGAVLDVAGGGQRQEAEQAAGKAGSGHGEGAWGFGVRWLWLSLWPGLLCPGPTRAEQCLRGPPHDWSQRAAAGSGPALLSRPLICRGQTDPGQGHRIKLMANG